MLCLIAFADAAQGKSVIADDNLTIPLLMRNKVPEGFETDDRLDVSLRPDEVRVNYMHLVPTAAYG